MYQFNPTEHSGRILTGDTPYGRFRVEWDAKGKLVSESIEIREPQTRSTVPCIHRGDALDIVDCESCAGSVNVKVLSCTVHGRCTIQKQVGELACCAGCGEHQPNGDSAS